MKARFRAALIHVLLSATLGALLAAWVFLCAYPGALWRMIGAGDLFSLCMAVDLCLGPLLTFAVFDVRKERQVLRRDLLVIGLVQLSAMAYGMWVVARARPVAVVFEVDRMVVVAANAVREVEYASSAAPFAAAPWCGPRVLGARRSDGKDVAESVDLAMAGYDLAQRPSRWVPYESQVVEAVNRALPVAPLLARQPDLALQTQEILGAHGVDGLANVRYLPVVARRGEWVALLAAGGKVLGYLKLDEPTITGQ